MKLEVLEALARTGRLYPSVILHGADGATRRAAAVRLGRALLCERSPEDRPCGSCGACRRIDWPEDGEGHFHPDFGVLEQDLRTVTSVEATRSWLHGAVSAPYEARGQVFVVAAAETLSGEAANALLKILEEPRNGAPRHFLLLSPSRYDLLPTLRSRSLSFYLGAAIRPAAEETEELADALRPALVRWADDPSPVWLLALASVLGRAGGWEDARSAEPWGRAATALLAAAGEADLDADRRRRVLALTEELLDAPRMRMRGIPAPRILDGLVGRCLAGPAVGAGRALAT